MNFFMIFVLTFGWEVTEDFLEDFYEDFQDAIELGFWIQTVGPVNHWDLGYLPMSGVLKKWWLTVQVSFKRAHGSSGSLADAEHVSLNDGLSEK